MIAYRLKTDSTLEPKAVAGSVVYPIRGHDYGSASDDTAVTGIPHCSVTLDRAGGYPYFTIPVQDIEQIDAPDFEGLDEDHVKAVCQPGAGAKCCRYLTLGAANWSCAKLTTLRMTLDIRADAGNMNAIGDNCEGRT